MIEFAAAVAAIVAIRLITAAVRRAHRRGDYNPNDIYPLW